MLILDSLLFAPEAFFLFTYNPDIFSELWTKEMKLL